MATPSGVRGSSSDAPRVPRPFVVFSFATTHQALDAEDALRAADIAVVPIPTPKSATALCGISLRIDPDQRDIALAVLDSAQIPPAEEHELLDV